MIPQPSQEATSPEEGASPLRLMFALLLLFAIPALSVPPSRYWAPPGWVNFTSQMIQLLPLVWLFHSLKLPKPIFGNEDFLNEDFLNVVKLMVLTAIGEILVRLDCLIFAVEPTRATASEMLHSSPSQIGIGLAIVIGAPLVEELFFRGILLRVILAAGCSLPLAIMLQAIPFALVHGDVLMDLQYIWSGLFFGLAAVSRGGLPWAMFLHFTWNGAVLLRAS